MRELRIVFMGTPDFAVPCLEILLRNKFQVVAVVTATDKPKGRGQKPAPSPVKKAALQYGLPVLQPTNLKAPEFIEELRSYTPNLFVVVAFRMLPEQVWSIPAYGTFNLHASLLPQYRGAAPINWAIINGEKETGVTTFFIEHQIDTGHVIFSDREPIHDEDTAGDLHDRLAMRGAKLVLKTVQAIESGDPPTTPQPESGELRKAPKIFRETCQINWNQSTNQVINFIRGLSPYPGAWTVLNGKTYKILRASAFSSKEEGQIAAYKQSGKSLLVKTADGWVSVLELQPEGRKKMTAEEFLRGNTL